MKKGLIMMMFALTWLSQPMCAQNTQAQVAEEKSNEESVGHLKFNGFELGTDIDSFTEQLKEKYELKRKMGGDKYFIFYGFVLGHDTYFQVHYSKKSKTVYKVQIMPKNAKDDLILELLTEQYGEPMLTTQGQLWKMPEGLVLMHSVENSDPAIIYLDSKANEVFVKEK